MLVGTFGSVLVAIHYSSIIAMQNESIFYHHAKTRQSDVKPGVLDSDQ